MTAKVCADTHAITTLEELKTEAKKFYDLGIPVIPFVIYWNKKDNVYEKDNIGGWKKWQTEIQTDEEFNTLSWTKNGHQANGFGVLLGTKAKNGKYLGCVDYDTKKATPEAIKKGKEILKDFRLTRIDKTINDGLHYFYWANKKPPIDATFHDDAGLELLGYKKLCLLAPSYGYKELNDNTITEIPDLEEYFFQILKKHGFTKKEQTEIENQQDRCSFNISKIVDLTKFTKTGDEYQGSHPIHDSTTEKNFCVNPQKNTWHCFRHNSGGGALQFLAVKEGIIKCEEAKKGALRGKRFKQVLQIAASQGLVNQKLLSQSEINPVMLAKDIKEDYVFVTDEDSNELYHYMEDQGIYSIRAEQLLRREIARRLDENFKNRYYTEIYEFIKATAPLVKMDNFTPETLPVANGILNVLTNELNPFTPKIYATTKIDTFYEQKRKWEKSYNKTFLEQVVTKKETRTQMQELVGHTLIRRILTETCLVCLGEGGNGKTIWLTSIKNFLGTQNVSGLSMQQICYDKFKTVELRGKLANIAPDLPQKELKNTGIYKAVISGEAIPISVKHVQGKGITFEPFAKFFYSANALPPIESEEDCYAWYRRFTFADFNVTFSGKKAIPRQELLDKLTTEKEKSALLNWALEGLKRLIKNGEISYKPTVEQIRKEYRRRSSTTLAYFDDCVTVTDNPNDVAWTNDWFREYVTYCHKKGLRPVSKGKFTSDAEKHLAGIKKTKVRKGTKGSPLSAWRYVTVKDITHLDGQTQLNEKNTKENKSVPNVPDVPTSENISSRIRKNEENTPEDRIIPETGTDGTYGTELGKLETLRNWVKTRLQKGDLHLKEIKDKIIELDFESDERTILRKLTDSGDLVGVDVV